MSEMRYTQEHEYIRVEGDTGTVGISDYAQSKLGDVVFVELPESGRELETGKEAAVIESVKAASEVYAPVSGTVTEGNPDLEGDPALVNRDAFGEGWFFKMSISNKDELEKLMDEAAYASFIEGLE